MGSYEELKVELQEVIADSVSGLTQAQKALDDKIKHNDEIIAKIGQKADAIDKDAFVKTQDEMVSLEKTVQDLAQKLDGLKSKNHAPVGVLQKALESGGAKSYSGGEAVLGSIEKSIHSDAFAKSFISTDAGEADVLVQTQLMPGIYADPMRQLTIRDLIPSVRTTSDSIKFLREKLFENNAAPQVNQGDEKKQSSIEFMEETVAVETIAHWFAMSRQALADIPTLMSYVKNKGVTGLKEKEEDQLLFGDGSNGNLHGIMPQASAFDTSLVTAKTTQQIDYIRLSILQNAKNGYRTNGIVMSPTDWAYIELMKDDSNSYLFTNPVNGAAPRMFGRSIIESPAMSAGQFLTGDFSKAATIHDREQVTLRASESHDNYFTRNLVAVLIEERLALSVEYPKAINTGTFPA